MTDITQLLPGVLFFLAAVAFGCAAVFQTEPIPQIGFFLAYAFSLIASGGFVISFLKKQ